VVQGLDFQVVTVSSLALPRSAEMACITIKPLADRLGQLNLFDHAILLNSSSVKTAYPLRLYNNFIDDHFKPK